MIDYNGKVFRTVQNTANGEVNESTIFYYFQNGNMVWADYSGGDVIKGHLIAKVDDRGNLDMRYHHINKKDEIMTGICYSKTEVLENGKLRLHEEWEWTCRDNSKGKSIVEEV